MSLRPSPAAHSLVCFTCQDKQSQLGLPETNHLLRHRQLLCVVSASAGPQWMRGWLKSPTSPTSLTHSLLELSSGAEDSG